MADVKGGNGDIFFDESKKTATKYLRNTSTREKIERFINEINTVESLKDELDLNVVKVYETYLDRGDIKRSYIKMERCDGTLLDLYNMTKGNARFICEIMEPIVETLDTLATRSPAIFHRDLKPENILYTKIEGRIKLFLTDFGICFVNDEHDRLTDTTIAIGSRLFIAPEYEMGKVDEINEKGDIFSLGKILWCMANGIKNDVLPFNLWFVDQYNLSSKFPAKEDIIKLNILIASCLETNPLSRCNYKEILSLMKNIISNKAIRVEENEVFSVREFQEKRTLELVEIMEKNKHLVNFFSYNYLAALKKLLNSFKGFPLLEKLLEYEKKNNDNYWSVNVLNNSTHYLYSTSFDKIYLDISYYPASGDDTYARICLSYKISNNKSDKIFIMYESNGLIGYTRKLESGMDDKLLHDFLKEMVMNYIK